MEVQLNSSAAGVSALEIELTPINLQEPTWVGGFAIFACLDPYGRYNWIHVMRKYVFGISDQVRLKLGCVAIEDG